MLHITDMELELLGLLVVGKTVKLKYFETIVNITTFCAFYWCYRRPVTMLSTLHEAAELS